MADEHTMVCNTHWFAQLATTVVDEGLGGLAGLQTQAGQRTVAGRQ